MNVLGRVVILEYLRSFVKLLQRSKKHGNTDKISEIVRFPGMSFWRGFGTGSSNLRVRLRIWLDFAFGATKWLKSPSNLIKNIGGMQENVSEHFGTLIVMLSPVSMLRKF